MSRLLFISTKNRWFYRTTMLACAAAFALVMLGVNTQVTHVEPMHRDLAYCVMALIAGLTCSAPFYKKQFTLQPFVIGIILLPLAVAQIVLCLATAHQQATPVMTLAHLIISATLLGLLWWMGRLTSPELPPATHSSIHQWRPWAWLALFFLAGQMALGAWVSANFNAPCEDFPFCHGQLLPSFNKSVLTALLHPAADMAAATLADIQLLQQLGVALTAFYLAVFSLILLFNRYLYQLAIVMLVLLGAQVTLHVYALDGATPTVFYYYAASLLMLITLITLLTNLYRKTQDYWYG